MSDTQAITKFESLPNEILIECFEYLNAVDIFNAFDYLNFRFHKLIRNIPLHLDVGEGETSTLVQFGIKILLNPQMKEQIMSLKLSGNDISDKMKTFFSFISLNELSNLQTLIVLESNEKVVSQMSSMIPLFTDLPYISSNDSYRNSNQVFASLSTSALRNLWISRLPNDLPLNYQFRSLVNLKVFSSCIDELCRYFIWSPNLEQLDIKYLRRIFDDTLIDNSQLPYNQAVHLKRLVIHEFFGSFVDLEILLQQTPNIELLTVSTDDEPDTADAFRWRKLLETSLPFLDVFKFKFRFNILEDEDNSIVERFPEFQTDFWHEQHHWYTEYVLRKDAAHIYTIPYISKQYEIKSDSTRYFNRTFNNINTFAKVIDLKLSIQVLADIAEYYFPNVISLRLNNTHIKVDHSIPFIEMKHVECLKTVINLLNLIYLDISTRFRMKSLCVMLQLLKEAPNISYLAVNKLMLFEMFKSHELCEYLTKMIKKLTIVPRFDVHSTNEYLDLEELTKLCEIFLNMEEFRCAIDQSGHLEMVLNQLSKVNHLKVFFYNTWCANAGSRWLDLHKSESDSYSFAIKYEYDFEVDDDENIDDG